MVVMDKKNYLDKVKKPLEQSAYGELTSDSTATYKTKLINIFKRTKMNKEWMTTCASTCIQQGQVLLSSMAFQKSTKEHPFRLIVSGRDFVTYGVAKELVGILQPPIGR